jgi:hypothetical protein
MEFISSSFVISLWSCAYADWCFVASKGASGGILLMWDRRMVTKIEVCVGDYVVAFSFKNVEDVFIWEFAGVYGPNLDIFRRFLWEELAGLISWWDIPWCIGGDLNVTHFPSERSGGVRYNPAMSDFSDFISEQGFMDLPLAGGTFTWSNSHSRSRINRFLVSLDWEVKYLGLIQKRLLRLCLDHFPILLNCDALIRGKRPFKFENMWLKNEGFVDRVRSWWSSYTFLGNLSFVLARKLKALKADIKRWNEVEFSHVGALFIEKADVLKAMDRLEEERGLGEEDKERKRVIWIGWRKSEV